MSYPKTPRHLLWKMTAPCGRNEMWADFLYWLNDHHVPFAGHLSHRAERKGR
jgi:hypothetical protein